MNAEAARSVPARSLPVQVSLLLAAAWGTVAALKVGALDQLAAVLDAAMLFPPWLASPLAVALVAWEAAVALGLLIPIVRRAALWATAMTLLAYLGFAVWRAVAGIDAPCQCFGPLLRSTPGASAAVCLVLLVPTILGLRARCSASHQGEGNA
ncbi:MAG: hypothetical protein GX446_10640 [Chthonomonadales bacterium]|nr:hypothetical protein [Chthonomonadales bacterium]